MTLKELLAEQDATLEALEAYRASMRNIRDELNGGIVPWAEINKIDPGQPFTLLPGIVSYRMESVSPDVVVLLVIMGPRAKFKPHGHDCPELGQLIQGDVKVNGKELLPRGTFYFDAEEEHWLDTEYGCVLVVQFPRPGLNEKRPAAG